MWIYEKDGKLIAATTNPDLGVVTQHRIVEKNYASKSRSKGCVRVNDLLFDAEHIGKKVIVYAEILPDSYEEPEELDDGTEIY